MDQAEESAAPHRAGPGPGCGCSGPSCGKGGRPPLLHAFSRWGAAEAGVDEEEEAGETLQRLDN